MENNKKSLNAIIEELASKFGYPHIKLNYSENMQILKQAQAEWLNQEI